jgi:hypothetical protein
MSSKQFEAAVQRERVREQLARMTRGGARDRPIRVSSAAVIEPRTIATPCPRCGGEYRIHEHVRPSPDRRRVEVACRQCATPRALWFEIVADDPN